MTGRLRAQRVRNLTKRASTSTENKRENDKKARSGDADVANAGQFAQATNAVYYMRSRCFEKNSAGKRSYAAEGKFREEAKLSDAESEQVQFELVHSDGINYLRSRRTGQLQGISCRSGAPKSKEIHRVHSSMEDEARQEPVIISPAEPEVLENEIIPVASRKCLEAAVMANDKAIDCHFESHSPSASTWMQDAAEILNDKKIETSYEELRGLQHRGRIMLEQIEDAMHMAKEREIAKLRAERAESEAESSVQLKVQAQGRARALVKNIMLRNDRITMVAEFNQKLDKEREAVRADLERSHTAEQDALRRELVTEQEKNVCQICFSGSRDSMVFPCLHFQYCNACLTEHQTRSNECPTCRGIISGTLKCKLFA